MGAWLLVSKHCWENFGWNWLTCALLFAFVLNSYICSRRQTFPTAAREPTSSVNVLNQEKSFLLFCLPHTPAFNVGSLFLRNFCVCCNLVFTSSQQGVGGGLFPPTSIQLLSVELCEKALLCWIAWFCTCSNVKSSHTWFLCVVAFVCWMLPVVYVVSYAVPVRVLTGVNFMQNHRVRLRLERNSCVGAVKAF